MILDFARPESNYKFFDVSQLTERKRSEGIFESIFVYVFKRAKTGRLLLLYEKDAQYRFFGEGASTTAVIKVLDEKFFKKIILFGDVGFGEAFFLKYWDTPDLHNVLSWAMDNKDHLPTFTEHKLSGVLINLFGFINRIRHLQRPNSLTISKKNISEHYDLSNQFFKFMLDKNMVYSCAIFKNDKEDLYDAQINKFERLCRLLRLKDTDHLLEIGSGWGGFAIYVAEKYRCKIDTITISQEQFDYVTDLVKARHLDRYINVELKDYRNIDKKYDKIVSIEMVEALGFKYFDTFFRKCAKALKENGLMAIQCITFPDPYYKNYLKNTDFIQKHIFPGSELLSIREILNSLNRTSDLIVWDVKSLGPNYAKTLTKWKENIAANFSKIQKPTFDETFIRKWIFYLDYCTAGFANFYLNVNQILFSRPMNKAIGR